MYVYTYSIEPLDFYAHVYTCGYIYTYMYTYMVFCSVLVLGNAYSVMLRGRALPHLSGCLGNLCRSTGPICSLYMTWGLVCVYNPFYFDILVMSLYISQLMVNIHVHVRIYVVLYVYKLCCTLISIQEADFKTQTRPSSAIHIRLYKTTPPTPPTHLMTTPTHPTEPAGVASSAGKKHTL